jgi:hypothetical protein
MIIVTVTGTAAVAQQSPGKFPSGDRSYGNVAHTIAAAATPEAHKPGAARKVRGYRAADNKAAGNMAVAAYSIPLRQPRHQSRRQ